MRVPFNSSHQNFLNQVNSLNRKQVELQKQVSTGQRVVDAGDDSASVGRALNASSEKSKLQTYNRNLTRADFVGNFTLETLEQLKGVADSITNLVNTNDGLTTDGDLLARGYNANQLVSQGLQILNSQLSGDFLFAGANTGAQPFVAHYFTEFLEDENGNFVDLQGNVLGPSDPPVESVFVDENGDPVFKQVLDSSGNPIPENTYVDPATGYQTDSGGTPFPGPVSIPAGIDFNTGEVVGLSASSGTFVNILDNDGNPIIPPAGPDVSGTGFITTTRKIGPELIGQISYIEYTGTTDSSDDVAYRIGENSSTSPFSRGAANEEYAAFLNDMIAFRNAYFDKDIEGVKEVAPSFTDSQEMVTLGMVEIGSKLNGMEVIGRINELRFNDLETLISKEIDVDIAESIVELNRTQTAYEAALASGARVLSLSLLDYIN